MKKLTKNIIIKSILLFVIFLVCISCVEHTGEYKYYQIKNESGVNLKLKFYYSNYSIPPERYDSLLVKNNEYSIEFFEVIGGFNAQTFFIEQSDSIDLIVNELLVKRYKRNIVSASKTPYNKTYYDIQIVKNKDQIINVYTIPADDLLK